MRRMIPIWTALGLLLVVAAGPALSQGVPTGRITGTVSSAGEPLPGVLATAQSPNLQQAATTMTRANGAYLLPALPPGDYTITFELEGMETATREVTVAAAQSQTLDVDLSLAAVAEAITVTSETSVVSETSGSAITYQQQDFIEKLAVDRTITSAVQLAPGTASTGPSNNITISGGQSYENLYMINGVPVNENLRGQVSDLYIEDAIQEVTISGAGVSAEYGRFTGGIVNAVTKSGGNSFHGSLRSSFSNEDWQKQTPYEEDLEDKVNETYEGTFGGFLMRDHIWFFAAGRDLSRTGFGQTQITNIQFPTSTEESRVEGKLTFSFSPSHRLLVSAVDVSDKRDGNVQGNGTIDLGGVNNNVQFPEDSFAANYTGLLTDSFLIEGQYSERSLQFLGIGGNDSNLRTGTPWLDTSLGGLQYHQPIFCGNCPNPDTRETEHAIIKGSYFLTSGESGSHDLTFGADTFNDIRSGDNTQSATDFEVWSSSSILQGNVAFPVVVPFPQTFDTYIIQRPVLQSSLGTNFINNSVYINDRWQFNDKWSFNLGLRYDENDGEDSAGNKVANDSYLSPRLGVSYDLKGDGDIVFHATAGTYVTRLANGVADSSSAAGNPAFFGWAYAGPAINTDPGQPLTTPEQALDIIFDWFESVGGTSNRPFLFDLNIPGATSRVDGSLDSPNAQEITVGVSKRLGSRGILRADVVHREYGNFYFSRSDTSTGTIIDGNGDLQDLTLIQNNDDILARKYDGLQTTARYRVLEDLTIGGNWTWSHARGNFDGETTRTGPVTSATGRYPEYKDFPQNFPRSDLGVDQRHNARFWAIWNAFNNNHNRLSVSLLQSYFSGSVYGAAGAVDSRPYLPDLGYQTPPTTVTYWYTSPNAFKTDDITRTDLALNYSFVWKVGNHDLEIFIQPEVLNVFGEEGIDGLNISDVLDATTSSRFATFNPFVDTPVRGTNWDLGDDFGQPEDAGDYQFPRTFRFSVGFRF